MDPSQEVVNERVKDAEDRRCDVDDGIEFEWSVLDSCESEAFPQVFFGCCGTATGDDACGDN
jgi:hypothetical protein